MWLYYNRLSQHKRFIFNLSILESTIMFHSLFFPRVRPSTHNTSPLTDIYDDGKNYLLQIDAVGFTKDAFKISATQNTLSLEAKTTFKVPEGYTSVSKHNNERQIKRNFRFRDNIDTESIQASIDNGLLNITIPKKEARNIEVTIN